MKKPQPDYCETATLTYVLPDAKDQLIEALNASKYKRILIEIHDLCITAWSYKPLNPQEESLAQKVFLLTEEAVVLKGTQ